MKYLWAPWRMEYIKNIKRGGCIFCRKLKTRDDKAYIVKRKPTCFSMLNIFPYNNGHIMVAPKRHVSSLTSLTTKERNELMRLIAETEELIRKKLKPQGLNVGLNLGKSAGAGIAGHLHFHIVPRWNGDTNFMPVLSDTKVMPQYLGDTYRLLKND